MAETALKQETYPGPSKMRAFPGKPSDPLPPLSNLKLYQTIHNLGADRTRLGPAQSPP